MTIIDRACYERGCACYDDRVDKDGVEVVARQWVGLTDEEIMDMLGLVDWTATYPALRLAQAVQKKLKERNT